MPTQLRTIVHRFPLKMVVPVILVVLILVLANSRLIFAASPQVVGIAPATENSLEMIGRIDQKALSFDGYGYLTYIDGVSDNLMFTDPINRSEATAHFTYVTTASLTARSVVETLFVLSAKGTTTIYYNETPKADFKDPTSFASGTPIAVGSQRWQNIINVQSPDTGIATGIGEYTQTTANPFNLNGQDYVLGRPLQSLRFTYAGEGKRTDKIAPNSTLIIAGYATAGGQ